MILKLALDLPEDEHYIRTTRLLSTTLLGDLKVIKADIGDVAMIVTELCSNVIRHAQSKETHFKVELEYYEPKVVITVTDTGAGFDRSEVAPVGTARPDGAQGMRVGGYGLSLLEGISDKCTYTATKPHGATVRVEKSLHYETQGDANEATERDTKKGGTVTATKE